MSVPEIIMWATVLAIGIPSAWKNPTAGALVMCFVISNLIYALTGNGMAVEYYVFPDIFVISVIFCKKDYHGYPLCGGDLHQLKCLWLERSPADRFILCSFPLAWWFYVASMEPVHRYWALWAIALAQFLAAGLESLCSLLTRRAEAEPRPPSQGSLLVAHGGGGYG